LPSRQRTLALALCYLALVMGAQAVHANMAARQLYTHDVGSGALTAPGTGKLHVREVSLQLDFRASGRQASIAEYVLVNLDPAETWEDELIFVSTAATVTVTVDGRPAQVKPYGPYFKQSPGVARDLGVGIQGNGFRVRLPPGQESRIVVSFLCAPGKLELNTRYEDQQDGLLRLNLVHRPSAIDDHYFFSYPLWPAYGFAGGTGAMAITLLSGPGASPPEGADHAAWAAQPLAQGNTRWTIRLPAATAMTNTPMRQVYVRYPQPRPSRWHLGASAFAGLRFASRNEPLLSPHLALSADVVIDGIGACMLGGETAFSRSASVSLAFQRGPVSPWVSAYLGGAVLATFSPEVTPGFELRAGTRLVWLPLDIAFQAHPWAKPGEGDVARWRLLAGVRAGMW
jgi:hypothetical protein